MPIPTFDSLVEEYNLTVLSKDECRALMETVHPFMASCGRFAFSNEYILVWGGNLNYYAGLEYSHRKIVMQTPSFTLWEMDEDRCNLTYLFEKAQKIAQSAATA